MSALDAALRTLNGLLAREPAAVVVGVVELVRVTLSQADKRAALDRARRAAAGKAQVEAEVDAELGERIAVERMTERPSGRFA